MLFMWIQGQQSPPNSMLDIPGDFMVPPLAAYVALALHRSLLSPVCIVHPDDQHLLSAFENGPSEWFKKVFLEDGFVDLNAVIAGRGVWIQKARAECDLEPTFLGFTRSSTSHDVGARVAKERLNLIAGIDADGRVRTVPLQAFQDRQPSPLFRQLQQEVSHQHTPNL